MGLKSEIEKFNVDMDAVARIRKRVFVVGRFNQHRQVDDEPGIYLFSNRSDLSAGYLRNFTAHSTLDYESFVEALQPAIAEKVEYVNRHPRIVQGIPGSEEDLETSFVIDLFNYFFDRAVRHSDQPEFRSDHNDSDPELLQREERERGKGILQQVRRDLRSFSRFQHRNSELVEEAAKVLAKCSGVNGLPAYAYAGALPGGFPEALIDFLYSEEQYARFDARELEFTGEWTALANDDSARSRFEDVVTAFRDAAIDWEHLRFAEMFAGQPLHAQVRTSDRSLLEEFRKARAAVNRLRQILRSKVLLSMILEWVIESLNDLQSVREIDAVDEHARNEQMGRAILEEWEANGLARPIKRPNREERRRFESELCASFEDVVRGIVIESEEAASDAVSTLSPELRELVATLRKDAGTVDALRMMAGSDGESDRIGAFVDANQTVLRDVMCPTLFRTPLVSPAALRSDLRRETVRTYIAAVLLSDENEESVLELAMRYQDAMEEHVEGEHIRDVGSLNASILGDYINLTARPEVQLQVTESMRALVEAGLLHDSGSRDGMGVSQITGVRQHEGKSRAAERTPIKVEAVKDDLRNYVTNWMKKQSATSVDSGERSAGEGATGSAAVALGGGDAEDVDTSSGIKQIDDRIRAHEKVSEIMQAVGSDGGGSRSEVEEDIQVVSDDVSRDPEALDTAVSAERIAAQIRDLIYQRYAEKLHLVGFANKVEKLTLTNLMLLFQDELGLNKGCSNLYQMLLDLVLHMDPENPEPGDFLREKSLTVYFDNADLDGAGITDLRRNLEVQSQESLRNIVDFVSELRGVKYLMDKVGSEPRAEVVVVNATADEFLAWLEKDNLESGARGRLSPEHLSAEHDTSERAMPPGLVYMTDIAFAGAGQGASADRTKRSWVKGLSSRRYRDGELRYLLPPICISTGPDDSEGRFSENGAQCAEAAREAPAPVLVLGPSPRLNPSDDGFATILPAGYLFAAHVLNHPGQAIENPMVGAEPAGRFRVIRGAGSMPDILDGIVWGDGEVRNGDSAYAFAGDFFLYVVLNVVVAMYGAGVGRPDVRAIYSELQNASKGADWMWAEAIGILDDCVLGGQGRRFALANDPTAGEMTDLAVSGVVCSKTDASFESTEKITMTDVEWFNRMRRILGVH